LVTTVASHDTMICIEIFVRFQRYESE